MSASVQRVQAERFAQAFAALGVQSDRFRVFWADADEATRRMMLTIAKQPAWLSTDSWDSLGPEVRGAIKRRAASLRDWLNRTLPA